MLGEAIRVGLDHRDEALAYAEQFGRGIDRETTDRFVAMYVNELTLRLRRGRPPRRRGAAAPVAGRASCAEFVGVRLGEHGCVSTASSELYAIGATRIGDSPEEDAAHRLAAGWLREAGLEVEVDAAGQHRSAGAATRAVWIGSHLDSVPNGGRFDGVLGVVAGDRGRRARSTSPLAVVAFRDEERGCAGSRACVAAGRLPEAYLELHVEQGPVLERANEPLGIVTGDRRAVARGEVVFEGRADHAGTTPMDARDDALVAPPSSSSASRARRGAGTVATVGRLRGRARRASTSFPRA